MADEADQANDVAQMQLDHALERARNSSEARLVPVGECHNCGEGLDAGLFCDAECADDHAYTMHRQRMNRRVV